MTAQRQTSTGRKHRANGSVGRGKGITAISLENFKSLANDTEIAIRPLTIIAGANSSGK